MSNINKPWNSFYRMMDFVNFSFYILGSIATFPGPILSNLKVNHTAMAPLCFVEGCQCNQNAVLIVEKLRCVFHKHLSQFQS